MKKLVFAAIVCFIPVILFSQAQRFPIQMVKSEKFEVSDVHFNKVFDKSLNGESLEVQLHIDNLTDEPMDLYILAIATFEVPVTKKDSFNVPTELDRDIAFLATNKFSKDDEANYKYKIGDKDVYVAYPKDATKGVEPKSSAPYHLDHLKRRVTFYSLHFSKYRVNYRFFNSLTVYVFDKALLQKDKDKEYVPPVFYQRYKITKIRR